jgi:hypothetical protein
MVGAQPPASNAAAKPQFTREQLLPAAVAKMKQGVPMDAIIAGAKERYGVEFTPEDFGVQPTPQPQPQPQASPSSMPTTDPMGAPMPTEASGAGGPNIMSILQSLFGG